MFMTWTNDDLSSKVVCNIYLKAISQEMLKISILDMSLSNNNLRLQPYLPGANELKSDLRFAAVITLPYDTSW